MTLRCPGSLTQAVTQILRAVSIVRQVPVYPGFHDKAVTGPVGRGGPSILGDLNHSGQDQAELPGVALDGAVDPRRRFKNASADLAVLGAVDLPSAADDVPFEDTIGWRPELMRLAKLIC